MNGIAAQFMVELVAGLVSVFIGVWLALVVDRRLRNEDRAEREAEARQEFERTCDTVLGSVVKNIAEARRVAGALERRHAPALLASDLELAVWSANEDRFIALCPDVGMRVIFAQFFDSLRRLQARLDFRNNLLAGGLAAGRDPAAAGTAALFGDVDRQLADLAEDVQLTGVLLVTDHGRPIHRQLFATPDR